MASSNSQILKYGELISGTVHESEGSAVGHLGMHRVPKWWRHKNDISEIMGFIRLFGTTYLKKVHKQNICSLVN